MPKKVTIEQLAVMVQRGFEQTATKEDLKALENKLTQRIDDLDLKFSAQSTRWQEDFDTLEGRVGQNETDVMALNKIVFKKR